MHMHGVAEVAYDPLRAQAAGFLLVGIAPFDMQQLLVPDGHASAADPVFAIPGVNVIEIGQRDTRLILVRISDRLRARSRN